MEIKKTTQTLKQSAQQTEPTFEQGLELLEKLVEAMESGDTPLAEMLTKFEEGVKLLKICETRLKNAEMKIDMLKKQKVGEATFATFPVADRE